MGDIIHALGVAQAIKTQEPSARITWVVRQNFAPLFDATTVVDEVITFDRHGGPLEFFRLLRKIRQKRYDVALDMQGLLRSGLMNLAARAKLKLCPSNHRECAWLFADRVVPSPAASQHAIDLLMEFLPPLGLKKEYAPLQLKPSAPAPELPAGTILIFPSSRGTWAQKEWSYFPQLTEALLNQNLGPVAWCSDLKLAVPAGALNFCAQVPLGELLPFIAQARLVLSCDNGPKHMAAALNVPTFALYGPTEPRLVGSYPLTSPRHVALCAPSGNIDDLQVPDVLREVEKLLAKI